MKVEGYIICFPAMQDGAAGGVVYAPHTYSFGKTVTEAWIRFMNIHPNDFEWDRKQTHWIDRGYCVKEATLEVKL